jgi:Zn-dependent protease
MRRLDNKVYLYLGLALLLFSFVLRYFEASTWLFWTLFGVAISLKCFFLFTVFREKGFRPSLWLYLILAGVTLILVSMLFKTVFPIPWLRNVLFYGAIVLKLSGLLLMIRKRGG